MAMNAEIKKEWIEALLSGEYEQGKGQLRDDQGKHCCLGVLTDIACKKGVADWSDLPNNGTLASHIVEWCGLPDVNPDIKSPHSDHDLIASYNDEGATFQEIAKIIEEQL